ncbi:MAG: VPLPA-CTERM sorting domain-containing protein [Pseudomonadota bacterium]|nr:VPLPA-CTERM sorting domain-containing protein [Pseudomonadota bacterium]
MKIQRNRVLPEISAALLFLGGLVGSPANAAVTLPGGDIFLSGAFQDIEYGATGLIPQLVPWLYVGSFGFLPFDVTESPTKTATTTDLTYEYSISGLGTGLTTISYTFGNTGSVSATDVSFIVHVNPDGSGTFDDFATVVPMPWSSPVPSSEPAAYQVADWFEDKFSLNGTNRRLDNTDSCAGRCDVEFALQWDLAELAPGMLWQVNVGLSDDGQTISSRYLEAVSADSDGTALTFSGNASVVPLPASIWFLGTGLLAMLGVSRRR